MFNSARWERYCVVTSIYKCRSNYAISLSRKKYRGAWAHGRENSVSVSGAASAARISLSTIFVNVRNNAFTIEIYISSNFSYIYIYIWRPWRRCFRRRCCYCHYHYHYRSSRRWRAPRTTIPGATGSARAHGCTTRDVRRRTRRPVRVLRASTASLKFAYPAVPTRAPKTPRYLGAKISTALRCRTWRVKNVADSADYRNPRKEVDSTASKLYNVIFLKFRCYKHWENIYIIFYKTISIPIKTSTPLYFNILQSCFFYS